MDTEAFARLSPGLEIDMRPTPSSESWQQFYDSARHNKVLDERTTLMLHLATAMAVGCYP